MVVSPFLQTGISLTTSYLFLLATWSFQNRAYPYRKEFVPVGANVFLQAANPIENGGKIKMVELFP